MKEQFIRRVAESLRTERFTLVDIGCSGGLEAVWRQFGERFVAVGFDASISECRRLAAEETNPNVRYVPGFVDIPPDHSFAKRVREQSNAPSHGSVYERFSATSMMKIRRQRLQFASEKEKFAHNLWCDTELADPARPVFAPQTLEELGLDAADFLKIDIDGADFRVLNSFDGLFEKLGILGLRLEVMLVGGTSNTAHTFHNTDRFMRRQGYELVRLDNYTYSMGALPARFAITEPAQTVGGRPYQAEAHYARDPAGNENLALTDDQLIKLAAIFSAWELPDSAAEILLTFRGRLEKSLNIDHALDVLAAQIQQGQDEVLSYRDYVAEFSKEAPRFFPPSDAPIREPTFWQRIRAARAAYWDWIYADSVEQARKKLRR